MSRQVSVTTRLFLDQTLFPLNLNLDSEITINRNGASVFALGGNDTVFGSAGVDIIDGGDGDDHIEGGGAADLLTGGAGDDTFLVRSPDDYPLQEIVSGGTGFDTLLFDGPGTFTVNSFATSVELFKLGSKNGPTTDNSNLIGTLLTYGAQFEGNDGSNVILGTIYNDQIKGGGGLFDLLVGLAGDDTIYGEDGGDIIFGDAPKPSELAQLLEVIAPLAEQIEGINVDDLEDNQGPLDFDLDLGALGGFLGSDLVLFILDEAFEFLTGSGNDTLYGGAGVDFLIGGDGDDQLFGEAGSDILIGGAGQDALDGGSGLADVAFYGLASSGVVVDLAMGVASNDGDGSSDTLSNIEGVTGSAFDDQISGDNGINILLGGDGNDTTSGAGGSDVIDGGAGDDVIDGGSAGDILNGGDGDDVITGGAGGDRLSGGLGADIFVYNAANETGNTLNVGSNAFNQITRTAIGGVALTAPLGGRDLITDFDVTSDKIDLSAIDAITGGGDDAFSFAGTFSNGGLGSLSGRPGDGEIKYQATGGLTYVAGNIGGTNADFVLVLQGELTLTADNFIL